MAACMLQRSIAGVLKESEAGGWSSSSEVEHVLPQKRHCFGSLKD